MHGFCTCFGCCLIFKPCWALDLTPIAVGVSGFDFLTAADALRNHRLCNSFFFAVVFLWPPVSAVEWLAFCFLVVFIVRFLSPGGVLARAAVKLPTRGLGQASIRFRHVSRFSEMLFDGRLWFVFSFFCGALQRRESEETPHWQKCGRSAQSLSLSAMSVAQSDGRCRLVGRVCDQVLCSKLCLSAV